MKRAARYLVLCLPLLACSACAPQNGASTAPDHPAMAPPNQPRAGVTHVVIIWLKDPSDSAARERVIQASESLRRVPGVLDVRVGRMLPSTRPVVDSTYDVGVVFTFADEQAMKAYLANPAHLKVLNEVLKPAADHYRVYDFR